MSWFQQIIHKSSIHTHELCKYKLLECVCVWEKYASINWNGSYYKRIETKSYLSHIMRKPAFCICKNKDAGQLPSICATDQHLCFGYIDSTIPLLSKSKISSLDGYIMWLYSPVCVGPGQTPWKWVLLQCGSSRELHYKRKSIDLVDTVPVDTVAAVHTGKLLDTVHSWRYCIPGVGLLDMHLKQLQFMVKVLNFWTPKKCLL